MTQKRDMVLATLGWTSVISFAIALTCLSILSPLAYCWILATVGSVVILGGGMVAAFWMSRDSILGTWFAMDMMSGLLKLVGAIFIGLLQASAGSSD